MIPNTNDSERNVCSTFTADGIKKSIDRKLVQPSMPQRQRRIQRVRFDESLNQSCDNLERSTEDCRQTWYTAQDYSLMRNNMQRDILEIQKKEKGIYQDQEYSVSEILQAVLKLVTSIDYEVESDASTILNDEVKHMLSQLYTRGEESLKLIGLEMHVEGKLRRFVKEYREQIQGIVYDIQREHLVGLLTDVEVHCELRTCCLNYTQAFGQLAQLRATAQLSAESTIATNGMGI